MVTKSKTRGCKAVLRTPQQYAFLPSYLELMQRLPSPTARITAIIISLFVLLLLIWSYIGQLDVHISATGQLTLPRRAQLIQPYELSEVVDILVENGQHVQAGDKLLLLNIVGSTQEIERCQEQRSFQQLALSHYRALLSKDPLNALTLSDELDATIADRTRAYFISTWQEYQTMLAKFNAELKTNQCEQIANKTSIIGLQKLLHNIQKRLAAHRTLESANLLARMELLAKEKERLEIELSLSSKQKELQILQARAMTLGRHKASYIAQKHREWYEQLTKTESALLIADQELAKAYARGRLQILRAPLDGIVQQRAIHTVGGIVQAAQTLMVVIPHNAPQQAEINIANKDIGFVYPGQSVTVKVEAFPYSCYGTIVGRLLSLSRDSVQRNAQNPELIFPAQIELEQNYIVINGTPITLTPGMTITADIKIGRRRVIDYLLSPIREYKSEACREL